MKTAINYTWMEETPNNGYLTGLNRKAVQGELEGTCFNTDLIFGMDHSKYKVVEGVFTPFTTEEVTTLDFDNKVEKAKNDIKSFCEEYILKAYPLTIQSSVNMGLYPEAFSTSARNFIGDCIVIENNTYDLLDDSTTEEQVETILSEIVWPIKPTQ